MTDNDLVTLRQRELASVIAVASWAFVVIVRLLFPFSAHGFLATAAIVCGWVSLAAWVRLDAVYRRARSFRWTLLAVFTGPVGFLLYYVSRTPVAAKCSRCGAELRDALQTCPTCGAQAALGRARRSTLDAYNRLVDSVVRSSPEQARETTGRLVLAFLVAVALVLLLQQGEFTYPLSAVLGLLQSLAIAGYWVLLAWWVYLDATWRRMSAMPWAVLTLATNVFGLVTYLVVRYPDPRKCPECAAYLPIGLKRCPYCGSEAQRTCPRCQASVEPDWVYCPACAGKLPLSQAPVVPPAQSDEPATLVLSGTVLDARSGSPIAGAEVKLDTRSAPRSTLTDAAGRFSMAGLTPRPYVLIGSMRGYMAEAKSCAPEATAACEVRFSLQPVAEE
jgi:hypothetical protein